MLSDIFNLYRNGEVIPFVLLAFLCVGYIIILEKFFVLQVIYKINFQTFNTQLKKMLLANDMERARNFTRAVSKTGLPMLAFRAIEAYEHDPMRVRATLSEEGLRFLPRLRRRLTQLPNLAAASVMLGAIAAVYGIWNSFQMVDGLEMGIKSFTFAKGLTLALLPLTISLVAAVLLMLPFGLLDAMAWRMESEIEHSLCVILNILAPDIQPVMAMAAPPPEAPPQRSPEPAFQTPPPPAAEHKTQSTKGGHDEPAQSKPASIPDEEEII